MARPCPRRTRFRRPATALRSADPSFQGRPALRRVLREGRTADDDHRKGHAMSLLAELKRRNVIRMAGLYLVASWLIVQVSSTILPMFAAPDWLPRTIVILLAIGFVPAMIFSWVYELTPQGIKRDADVPPE